MKRLPSRKRIRLAQAVYEGLGAFSVTISTARRRKLFCDESAVKLCLSTLRKAANRERMEVLAYCFMPDHLRLLLEGKEGGNLIRFVKAFKQTSAYGYRRIFGEPLWQKGFYDHILRKEEDVRGVAQYICENPVRSGLVGSLRSYPFVGGALAVGLRAT